MAERPVVKRTARAVLLDTRADTAELILIKRTKPGRTPYWVTPGGGVEPEDAGLLAALHRELDEELGGKAADPVLVYLHTVPHQLHDDLPDADPNGVKVQHFFACRLESMDPELRHGPEVDDPQGEYEIVRVPFTPEGIGSVRLVPAALQVYLTANTEAVLDLLDPPA